MLWEEWADVIPAEEIQMLDIGRQQEMEQALIDLGYLSGTAELRLHAHSFQQQFSEAIQQFRVDYFALGFLDKPKVSIPTLPPSELDSLELNLLHELCSLDGETTLHSLPQAGEVNLWTRIIHYRLVVLGLYEAEVDHPFGEKTLACFQNLSVWLQQSDTDILGLVNQIGDIPQLTKTLLDTGLLKRNVVTFRYKESGIAEELLQEVKEETEETEQETALAKAELEIEKEETKLLTDSLLSKEIKTSKNLEKRNKNKRSRIAKIKRSMNRLLKEEQALLTSSRTKELVIEKEINLLETRKKLLIKDFDKQKKEIAKQEELIKQLKPTEVKQLASLKQERANFQKELIIKKDLATTIVLHSQLSHENRLRDQHLEALKKSGARRRKLKPLKKELKAGLEQQRYLELDLQKHSKIKKLDAKIVQLGTRSILIAAEKHTLAILKDQKKSSKKHLKRVKRELVNKTNDLKVAKDLRFQKMGTKQLELATLNKRLKRLLEKVNGLRYRFKAQLSKSLDDTYYEELRKKVFQSRDSVFLGTERKKPLNLFLIRLIQIRQWMNGYYYGRLDSRPGNRTFQSIVEFTDEEDLENLRLKYILAKLGNQQESYWLLNAQYYFECLVALDERSGPEDSRALIDLYQKEFEKDNSIYNNETTKEAWASYTKELQQGLDGTGHRIRRFYYGVKSLAKSIGRVFGRIIHFIAAGVKRVIRILSNFIKLIYKEIREGTRNFFDGMDFLFGKRSIQTITPSGETVVTTYDFDFDSTVFMSSNCSLETIHAHVQTCVAKTNNLHFSLTLCGKVVNWVYTIVTSSLSWPVLALRIAFYFKGLVFDFIRRRKRLKRRTHRNAATKR